MFLKQHDSGSLETIYMAIRYIAVKNRKCQY